VRESRNFGQCPTVLTLSPLGLNHRLTLAETFNRIDSSAGYALTEQITSSRTGPAQAETIIICLSTDKVRMASDANANIWIGAKPGSLGTQGFSGRAVEAGLVKPERNLIRYFRRELRANIDQKITALIGR
jgi:hypothetical protein